SVLLVVGEYTQRAPGLVPVANVQLLIGTSVVLCSFVMASSVVVHLAQRTYLRWHYKAITRWQLHRVGTFESGGEAACVSIQVGVPPSSCCRGTPARPSQSSSVRRRADRLCRCAVTWHLTPESDESCRWARLRTESPLAPGRCAALERFQASHIGEGTVAHRASDRRGGARSPCRSPAETSRSAARY